MGRAIEAGAVNRSYVRPRCRAWRHCPKPLASGDRQQSDGRRATPADIARRTRDALADLARLDIVVDDEIGQHAWKSTTQLADLHGLSVYDATYLELAQRKRLAFVALDKALVGAAEAAGVEVI